MLAEYEYSESEMVEIDGSVLEGGGQILRISVALSAILGTPVKIKNIRASRPKPGLAAQHLTGIKLVAEMCQARLSGAALGSTEIEFIPGKLKGGTYYADTQTAGSISLLMQVALPCALLAPEPVTLELMGGTDAVMAPPIDYMTKIFAPVLRKFGGDFCVEIIRRGYFPRGGGHVRVTVTPVRQLRAARVVERGAVERITGWSYVAGSLPMRVANQMADVARYELQGEAPVDIHVYKESKDVARDNGWGMLLKAELSSGCVLGASALGDRGADADTVGGVAARSLLYSLGNGACLDTNAQDQMIIYMALASGQSSVRVGVVTLHTSTAIHVVQLLAKVEINVISLSEEHVIQCTGRGVVNENVY